MPRLVVLVLTSLVLAAPAQAKPVRVVPGKAVVGAAVNVVGEGFVKRGLKVSVGGRRAKVLQVRGKRLRIVVPKVPAQLHRVVVKRKRKRSAGRLRVLKPFSGAVVVKPDASRAEQATLGPAGGTLEARGRDGTRYVLTVPAGALASEQAITMTPATFGGLPLTGRAFGVDLAPDGLVLAQPATLAIDPEGALPGKRLGFTTHGDGFSVQAAAGTVTVTGFSSAGTAGTTAADFANAVQPLVNSLGTLTEGQVLQVIDLVARWSALFPPDFCGTQPVCQELVERALDSLRERIEDRCADGFANPSLNLVSELVRFESLRQLLGVADDLSQECRDGLLRSLFNRTKERTCDAGATPLGVSVRVDDIATLTDRGADLDGDAEVTHLELMFFLIGPLQAAALDVEFVAANDCAHGALGALPAAGKTLCATDRAAAERDLARALEYARRLQEPLTEYVNALDFCRIELTVVPASISIDSGAAQQFVASPQNIIDLANNSGVTWTAVRGSITADGVYTAPLTGGSDTVTATSVLNTGRRATGAVTVNGGAAGFEVTVNGEAMATVDASCAGTVVATDSGGGTSTDLSHTLSYDESASHPCGGDPRGGSATASGSSTASASTSAITASGSGQAQADASSPDNASLDIEGGLSVSIDIDGQPVPYQLTASVSTTETGGSTNAGQFLRAFGQNAEPDGTLNLSGTLQPGEHSIGIEGECFGTAGAGASASAECSYTYNLSVTLG